MSILQDFGLIQVPVCAFHYINQTKNKRKTNKQKQNKIFKKNSRVLLGLTCKMSWNLHKKKTNKKTNKQNKNKKQNNKTTKQNKTKTKKKHLTDSSPTF